MKVFRIQHPIGRRGPYCSSIKWEGQFFYVDLVCETTSKTSPEPDADGLLCDNFYKKYENGNLAKQLNEFLFAFTDINQAIRWFGETGICRLLDWVGFEMQIKEIPDENVIIGGAQCIVDKDIWINTPIKYKLTAEQIEEQILTKEN